jgi:hypothetical protein
LLKAGSAVTVESTLAGNAGLAAASIAHPASLSGAHTRLSLNENAFGCSARVVEAIRRNLTDLPRYTESEAHALSAQIAVKVDRAANSFIRNLDSRTSYWQHSRRVGPRSASISMIGWKMICRRSGIG